MFLYTPKGFSRAAGATAATRHNNCVVGVVVVCAVAGWEAGECRRLRRKCQGGLRKEQPCRRRCGCAEGAPAGRGYSEQLPRRTEPLPRRAAKAAALPKAGRSDDEGSASSQNKLIVIKPPKEKSPAGALFIIVRMHSVKARVFPLGNLPLTLDGLFRVPFC